MAGSPPGATGPAAPSGFFRATALARLRSETFDLVVVGGGVTGAGVALDAASRGLTTALVEKGDFAEGTSSKSSKLVHGGLRYLQQREFALVYENLAERQRLLENAPHLVTPLPFLIPLFGRSGVVSKAVARSYRTALWLYDLTGGLRIGKRHRRVTRAEALEHFPLLDTDRLVAGFLYYDAQTDDARLTLTILRTAVQRFGAVAANYVEATGFAKDARGTVTGVTVRDLEGGDSVEVRGRVVVNASGVWTDAVRGLGLPDAVPSLRPAKGVHVTVPRARFPADIAAVLPVRQDRRSIFVVPFLDADLVYLGTTDTDYEGPLDDPRCTAEDVDYLLGAANAVSSAGLNRSDVTGVWAGLRPLLRPSDGRRLSERTADLSRRHRVWRDDDGVITVTGGKLTTYRKMAEDAVDLAVRALGGPARRCVTKDLRLLGAWEGGAPKGGGGATPSHLDRRYGELAHDVRGLAESRPELAGPITAGLPYTGAEILYAAREEMALHLQDALARRTRATIEDARAAIRAAPTVAEILGDELGWDDARRQSEIAGFVDSVEAELATAGVGSPAAMPDER